MRWSASILLGLSMLLPYACSGREELSVGEECERNSDCGPLLLCEIGRCRRQCLSSRDCAAGLRCLPVDETLGGACQTEDEAVCAINSDCDAPLVCQMGTCATECVNDDDCLGDASCVAGACEEPELCVYNSDCTADDRLICAPNQTCRFECMEDRDCDTATRHCDPTSLRCVRGAPP